MLGVQGFHPQNEGVNFRQAYRWGLRGSYLNFTQVGTNSQHCSYNSHSLAIHVVQSLPLHVIFIRKPLGLDT